MENSPLGQKEVLLSKRKNVDDDVEGFRLRKRDEDDMEEFRLRKRSENQAQSQQTNVRVARMSQHNFISSVNDVPNIFRLGK